MSKTQLNNLKKELADSFEEKIKKLTEMFDDKVANLINLIKNKDAEIIKLNREIGEIKDSLNHMSQETTDLDADIKKNTDEIVKSSKHIEKVEEKPLIWKTDPVAKTCYFTMYLSRVRDLRIVTKKLKNWFSQRECLNRIFLCL